MSRLGLILLSSRHGTLTLQNTDSSRAGMEKESAVPFRVTQKSGERKESKFEWLIDWKDVQTSYERYPPGLGYASYSDPLCIALMVFCVLKCSVIIERERCVVIVLSDIKDYDITELEQCQRGSRSWRLGETKEEQDRGTVLRVSVYYVEKNIP
ncbi:hypothetical protein NDU88_002977 [Pleurodeles waltl]|uniref:Uncharacterized protein n=1 Tax=Pleurodeles waltl TaxID=8319 RepID=A0AAV7T404_PLEWA|nr:hypothetical protein NDU88_002977 [Pleurodeles waltl]